MKATRHFQLLDGLRGVAALAVVAYHFGGRSDLPDLMPRGYLAVDFFFVLSGLVVAHAYLGRLQTTMTTTRFLTVRAIRLWPMIVPATVFGAVIEYWRPVAGPQWRHGVEVLLAAVLGSFAIPWPFSTSMEQTIFPINGPVWSLFFEVVANIVFVVIAKRAFARSAVNGLVAAGLAGLVVLALATGSLEGGPLLGNWPGGFPRVVYSFFIGVVLNTVRRRVPALPLWVFPAILLAIFMVPVMQGPVGTLVDFAAIVVVFPLIVASASHATPTGVVARLSDACGQLSYPLYAVHYPIVRAICFILNRHPVSPAARVGVCIVSLGLICCVSWILLRFYDQPFRRLLTRLSAPASGAAMADTRGQYVDMRPDRATRGSRP